VDRSSAVRQLPVLHAVAIRLLDEGCGDHVIAVALDVDDGQVPILLRIAQRKLWGLITSDTGPEQTRSRADRPHGQKPGHRPGHQPGKRVDGGVS
jgi:hypothetical protein